MRTCLTFSLLLLVVGRAAAQTATLEQLHLRAIAADSNDAGTHYDLAMAYWDKKQWDSVEASLRTAIRIAPSYADAYLALSTLPNARGEKYWRRYAKEHGDSVTIRLIRENRSHYRRAFLLNPLVNLKPLGKYDLGPLPLMDFLRDGITDLFQGNYTRAYLRLDAERTNGMRVVRKSSQLPSLMLWYHALAAAHVDSFDVAARDFDDLFAQAKQIEEMHPESAAPLVANDYLYFVSTMLYLAGHFDEAIAGFTRAVEGDLSLYVAHVQMARMYEASDRWEEAITERQRALETNPEDPALMVELAATLATRGRVTDALPLLEQASKLNPRDPRVPYLQGQAALSAGNRDDARRLLNRFLAIAPTSYAHQKTQVRSQLEKLP